MKVMISQPMNGKTTEQIKNERAEIIDKFNKLHIDVIDTVFNFEAPIESNAPVYYLAESIKEMSKVDAVYFMENWQLARGCKIERKIAEEYGIKILDTDFLYEKSQVKRKV